MSTSDGHVPVLAPPPREVGESEDSRLEEFGYEQRLDRSIGKIASFAIGFSTISATTAVFTGFGAGYSNAGAPFIWTLFLAIPVFLLWTLVAADVAAKIPLAGYAYQWTSRLNGAGFGWVTGYCALIGWTSGMTSLGYIFAGYFADVFGINASQTNLILIAICTVVVATVINAYKVSLATLVNNIGVGLEILVTVGVTLLVAIIAFATPHHSQPISSLFEAHHAGSGSYLAAWLTASLGPFFGLVGVEAVADIAEETKGARRVIPRTMFYAFAASCVIEFLMYLVYTLAIRNPAETAESSAPIELIIRSQAGEMVSKFVVVIALTNIFACLLSNLLVGTRLLYSMSRDNMTPFAHRLRHVSPKRKTPSTSVVLLGTVSVLFLCTALVSVKSFTYFLGIATLAFFGTYALQAGGLLLAARRGAIPEAEPGTFDLGRFRVPVLVGALVMFLVVLGALIFLPTFYGNAYVFAGFMVPALLWWVFVLRQRLATGEAGPTYAMTHPEEEMV